MLRTGVLLIVSLFCCVESEATVPKILRVHEQSHGLLSFPTPNISCIVQPRFREKSGIWDERFRWPNAIIPFAFDDGYPIKHVSTRTCIRFVPRTYQNDFVLLYSGSGCNSEAGRVGGKQLMSLPTECFGLGPYVHEMLHAIGFEHEHQRPDRDDYVTIHWENIQDQLAFAFDKLSYADVSTFGVPYDYDSIMHYPSDAFSANGKNTITPKQPGTEIGQTRGMSELDIVKVNRMHKC